jgi:uncharacterized OB-fold protein
MAAELGTVRRDGSTDDFLDSAARGAFLLRRCGSCGAVGGPQEAQCPACGSTATEPFDACGRAELVSWSVVHGRLPDGSTGPQTIVAIGRLEEGPWWWTQILDVDPADADDALRVGLPLRVTFEAAGGGETLPVFRPAL